MRLGEQRRDRVDGYLRAQIPSWSLFPLVRNLCALRGLDTIASAGQTSHASPIEMSLRHTAAGPFEVTCDGAGDSDERSGIDPAACDD